MIKHKFRNNNVSIIQVYAPTSHHGSNKQQQKNEDETNTFYDKLQNLVDNAPNVDEPLIIGDFNSTVGGPDSTYPDNIEKHNN